MGARLREARTAAGLTQRDLSFPGCTPAYISRIEAGARIPSYQILLRFAKRLGVSAQYLATGKGSDGAEGGGFFDPLFEAEIALRLGDDERAAELYEEACQSASSVAAVRAEVGLGQLALKRAEVETGVSLLEGALTNSALPASDAALAGNALGRAYAGQGRFEEAFAIFKRFLAEGKERGDQFEVLRFSVLLANAYIDSGDFMRAQEVLSDVLDLARKAVDPMLRASLYWSQSRLYSSQGKPDLAAEYAQMTIAILKASEHTIEAARSLLLLAHIENDRGNPSAALELVEEGEPIVAAAGERADEAMFVIERARALDALGGSEEAAGLLLGALAHLNDVSRKSAGHAYAEVAQFFRAHGDSARALELYQLAAERFETPDRQLAEVLTAMAEIHEQEGRPEQALQLLKEAVRAQSGAASLQ